MAGFALCNGMNYHYHRRPSTLRFMKLFLKRGMIKDFARRRRRDQVLHPEAPDDSSIQTASISDFLPLRSSVTSRYQHHRLLQFPFNIWQRKAPSTMWNVNVYHVFSRTFGCRSSDTSDSNNYAKNGSGSQVKHTHEYIYIDTLYTYQIYIMHDISYTVIKSASMSEAATWRR